MSAKTKIDLMQDSPHLMAELSNFIGGFPTNIWPGTSMTSIKCQGIKPGESIERICPGDHTQLTNH